MSLVRSYFPGLVSGRWAQMGEKLSARWPAPSVPCIRVTGAVPLGLLATWRPHPGQQRPLLPSPAHFPSFPSHPFLLFK